VSDGSAPRTAQQNAGLELFADAGILREYCQPHDPICAPHTNNTNMAFHLDYFNKWGDEAAGWIVSKARNASGDTSDKTSGALKDRISHPVANVFILFFVLFLI
jgi:acetylxylan esterase